MNVKQLKEELSKYPDTMDVFMDERLTEFKYGLVNGVTSKFINFLEDEDGEVLAQETVLILSEE
jgi:hypothetical protein